MLEQKPSLQSQSIQLIGQADEIQFAGGCSTTTSMRTASDPGANDVPPGNVPSKAPTTRCGDALDVSTSNEAIAMVGRDQETQILRQAFLQQLKDKPSNTTSTNQLLLVSGVSGTGKTCLVQSALQELVLSKGGYYLVGKFDQQQFTPEPYRPIVAALSQLATQLDPNQSLVDTLGTEVGHALAALAALAPDLGRCLWKEGGSSRHHSNGKARPKRTPPSPDQLRLAMTKLFQTVANQHQPVVMVMDDLQWSDSASLGLLEALIADTPLQLVGICRSNEVEYGHELAQLLRRLEDNKGIHIVHVALQALNQEDTARLVAQLLPTRDNNSEVATMIYQRTQGNPFFVEQLVKAFQEEGLPGEVGNHDADVVELVRQEILRQPQDQQAFLQRCACVGAELDQDILNAIVAQEESLHKAVEAQMLLQLRPGRYAFGHDRIQQAAYSLVADPPQAHLQLGRRLMQHLTAQQLDTHLFLVVNQLSLGASLLTAPQDKTGLAELCLKAGKRALKVGDADSAIHFLQSGIELLPPRHWRDEYHLSLQLFGAKAEAECTRTYFEQVDKTIDEILVHCRSDNDKLGPYLTKIYSLQMRDCFHEALSLGLQVLNAHKVKIPQKPKLMHIIWEAIQLSRRLAPLSNNDILDLELCEDGHIVALMSVLLILQYSAFVENPDFFPLLAFRMVKLSLKHGLCDVSPLGFASYGIGQIVTEDFASAERYAMLAETMHERLSEEDDDESQLRPRLQFLVHAFVYYWTRPMQQSIAALQPVGRQAFDVGDLEIFMAVHRVQFTMQFCGKERLPVLRDFLQNYFGMLSNFMQVPHDEFSELNVQVLTNLMVTKKEDSKLVAWQDFSSKGGGNFNIKILQYSWYAHQIQYGYLVGDVDLALRSVYAARSLEASNRTSAVFLLHNLYEGMALLEATTKHRVRNRGRAKTIIKRFERWSQVCPENFLDKFLLLRGEQQAFKGRLETSLDFFAKAIEYASKRGVLYIEALANERAGASLARLGVRPEDSATAGMFFERAIYIYNDWGAAAVVDHIKKKYSCYLRKP